MLALLAPGVGMGGTETVVPTDTIDGQTTVILTTQYEGISIFTDETEWWIGV